MQPGEGSGPVSAWVGRHAALVPPGGCILDLAAGGGRHARYFKDLGYRVTALDRDVSRLADLAGDPAVEVIAADLEDGSPWPLGARRFAGIVVTNYLHRPLFPSIAGALLSGGVLIYETFGAGNARFGKPSNPAFLLQPGELLDVAAAHDLTVLAYRCGEVQEPHPAMVQGVVLRK